MATFYQQGQKVKSQYNAETINFGGVQNCVDLAGELKKLQEELHKAIEQKALEGDIAIDAEYEMKKAVAQAENPEPNKTTLLEHLNKAKELVGGASGLAGAFGEAISTVGQLF